MKGRVTKFFDSQAVQFCAVPFVAGKPVFGVFGIQPVHELISRGLGEYGGAGDAQ